MAVKRTLFTNQPYIIDMSSLKELHDRYPYLIAMAICEQATIITQENKTKANRIPPIAGQFGIRSLNLLEFFQELKIKL